MKSPEKIEKLLDRMYCFDSHHIQGLKDIGLRDVCKLLSKLLGTNGPWF
jgi:hypothetical protein